MSVVVVCPGCGRKGQAPDHLAGTQQRCVCGASVAIPAAAPHVEWEDDGSLPLILDPPPPPAPPPLVTMSADETLPEMYVPAPVRPVQRAPVPQAPPPQRHPTPRARPARPQPTPPMGVRTLDTRGPRPWSVTLLVALYLLAVAGGVWTVVVTCTMSNETLLELVRKAAKGQPVEAQIEGRVAQGDLSFLVPAREHLLLASVIQAVFLMVLVVLALDIARGAKVSWWIAVFWTGLGILYGVREMSRSDGGGADAAGTQMAFFVLIAELCLLLFPSTMSWCRGRSRR